jgi:dynactin-6
VEATSVGDGTIIEGAAKVGPGAVIGQHCRIGPHCTVPAGEVLEDFTVIYGENLRRTDVAGKMMMDANLRNLRKQVETMRRLIPSKPEKFM